MFLTIALLIILTKGESHSLQTETGPKNGGSGIAEIISLDDFRFEHPTGLRRLDSGNYKYGGKIRKKRASSVGLAVRATRIGIAALRRVLTGAKKTEGKSFHNEYSKSGGYSQTLKDFEAVNPTNVREFQLPNGIQGKIGDVGDRRLLAISEEEYSGQPLLEIRKMNNKYGQGHIHTIYYDR